MMKKDDFLKDYNELRKIEKERDEFQAAYNILEEKHNAFFNSVKNKQWPLVDRIINQITDFLQLKLSENLFGENFYFLNSYFETVKYMTLVELMQYKFLIRISIPISGYIGDKYSITPITFSKPLLMLINVNKDFEATLNMHEAKKSLKNTISELERFLSHVKQNRNYVADLPRLTFWQKLTRKRDNSLEAYICYLDDVIEQISKFINNLKQINITREVL
jgi:hypothetical protein